MTVDVATLLVACQDRKGLVASLAQVLYGHGANILDSDQHSDPVAGMFFRYPPGAGSCGGRADRARAHRSPRARALHADPVGGARREVSVKDHQHSSLVLPAFVGANPYKQAYEKGVKLIGATSHYVTAELDQGPSNEQATILLYAGKTVVFD